MLSRSLLKYRSVNDSDVEFLPKEAIEILSFWGKSGVMYTGDPSFCHIIEDLSCMIASPSTDKSMPYSDYTLSNASLVP